METDYFHRPCGTWLFTRHAGPYFSGELVTGRDVIMADGKPPVLGTLLKCQHCNKHVPFWPSEFRVHVRRD